MLIKRLPNCEEITAGDGTHLRELLHPARDATAVRYSLAVARLVPGARSKAHRLASTEVYYFVRGSGIMHIGDEVGAVASGDAVYNPADSVQWLENNGEDELEFVCIVDPAWRREDERVV